MALLTPTDTVDGRSEGLRIRGLRERLAASGMHATACLLVASGVIALVYLGWYPAPLDRICGVGEMLALLLAVDLTLGPVLTFIVFDRRKKSLYLDLTCIALVQIAALLYGLYTVEAGRPHYLVFVKDRFEVVSLADLRQSDREAASGNRDTEVAWFEPRVIAAELPTSDEARKNLLFESVLVGRDVQHFPKQYRDYASQAVLAANRAQPLSELRTLNPEGHDALHSAIERSGLPESRLRFLPIKGPVGDAAMLVDASSGAIKGMIGLQPWR